MAYRLQKWRNVAVVVGLYWNQLRRKRTWTQQSGVPRDLCGLRDLLRRPRADCSVLDNDSSVAKSWEVTWANRTTMAAPNSNLFHRLPLEIDKNLYIRICITSKNPKESINCNFLTSVNWGAHCETGDSGANYRCYRSAGTDEATGTSAPNGPSGNYKSRGSHWRRSNATAPIRHSNRN